MCPRNQSYTLIVSISMIPGPPAAAPPSPSPLAPPTPPPPLTTMKRCDGPCGIKMDESGYSITMWSRGANRRRMCLVCSRLPPLPPVAPPLVVVGRGWGEEEIQLHLVFVTPLCSPRSSLPRRGLRPRGRRPTAAPCVEYSTVFTLYSDNGPRRR